MAPMSLAGCGCSTTPETPTARWAARAARAARAALEPLNSGTTWCCRTCAGTHSRAARGCCSWARRRPRACRQGQVWLFPAGLRVRVPPHQRARALAAVFFTASARAAAPDLAPLLADGRARGPRGGLGGAPFLATRGAPARRCRGAWRQRSARAGGACGGACGGARARAWRAGGVARGVVRWPTPSPPPPPLFPCTNVTHVPTVGAMAHAGVRCARRRGRRASGRAARARRRGRRAAGVGRGAAGAARARVRRGSRGASLCDRVQRRACGARRRGARRHAPRLALPGYCG